MNYLRQNLKCLSQGSRLEFIREFRHVKKEFVADYLNLGGSDPVATIRKYENDERGQRDDRIRDLANLYEVSYNAIKPYDFKDPVDQVYILMWMEEQFPFYNVTFEENRYSNTIYNLNVQEGIKEWKEMREKYYNKEITYNDYIEWKLHFEIKNKIK